MIKFLHSIFLEKHIHKTFLVIGLILTFGLSLFMPFFNEPDGQYHLAVSGRIAHSVIDTSKYGEPNIMSGMAKQKESYKDGTRFEKYYLTQANFIPWKSAPREIYYSVFNFVYWGHVVPAVGLFIGKMIYPSMGVMITMARLLSSLVSIVSLAFIIKYLKKAKLIYFAVFLSPVALNSFSSLSYDAAGFVVSGAFISILINIIVDRKLTMRRLIGIFITAVLVLIACKQNYWLLLLLAPFVILYSDCPRLTWFRKYMIRLKDNINHRFIPKLIGACLVLIFLYLISLSHGGLLVVIRRYLMTFGHNYSGFNLLNNDITSWLAVPYPFYNHIPTWVTAVWYLMIFAVLFIEDKFVNSKSIGVMFLVFFIIGVLGVFYIMLDYNGARTSYIEGIQGRYFTATIVLLQVFISSIKMKINDSGKRIVPICLFFLILVSNGLLLFDTVIALIMR